MAHFAEIDNNNVVLRVVVVSDDHQSRGEEYLAVDMGLGGTWLQTSYNTRGGIHYNPITRQPDDLPAFRKNYAAIGYTYDANRDAFIPPQPYPSWSLNDESCLWESPVPYPTDGNLYIWNESTLSWQLI